jgi:hypothetical protein
MHQNQDFFDNYEKLKEFLIAGDIDFEYRTTVVK